MIHLAIGFTIGLILAFLIARMMRPPKPNRFYRVAWTTWDIYDPHLVEGPEVSEDYCGPEVSDWENYCVSLLPEAAKMALARDKKRKSDGGISFGVDWHDIVECLLVVLKTKGYKELFPPEASFWGHGIQNLTDHGYLNYGMQVLEEDGNGGYVKDRGAFLPKIDLWAENNELFKEILLYNQKIEEVDMEEAGILLREKCSYCRLELHPGWNNEEEISEEYPDVHQTCVEELRSKFGNDVSKLIEKCRKDVASQQKQ